MAATIEEIQRDIKNLKIISKFVTDSFAQCLQKVLMFNHKKGEVNMSDKEMKLLAFMHFLRNKCGFAFDINNFDHRIKLQKYVFIAGLLGWDSGYKYDLYIRGPYSTDLAKVYYGSVGHQLSDEFNKRFLPSFDYEKFTQVIKGKNVAWLEVGATILSLKNNMKGTMDREKLQSYLLERTKLIKNTYPETFIADVLLDLVKDELI